MCPKSVVHFQIVYIKTIIIQAQSMGVTQFVDAQQTQFTQFVEAQQPRFVDAQQSQAEVSLFYLIFWIRNHCTVCLRFSYQFYIVII